VPTSGIDTSLSRAGLPDRTLKVDLGLSETMSTMNARPRVAQPSAALPDGIHDFLEEQEVDAGKLLQRQHSLSLRHRLVLDQPRLKLGLVLRLPVPVAGTEMHVINQIISKAFTNRPEQMVAPGQVFQVQDTVGHFWKPEDFLDLPEALVSVLRETFDAEAKEITHVREHCRPSGSHLSTAGAIQLGVSPVRAAAWQEGSAIPFAVIPPSFARKPYSSVYTSLDTLLLVCKEILRLLQLGKAMPWLKRPWILSPTALITKWSPFEADEIKKRIVYDLSASGVNMNLDDHGEMRLPTILRLLQSMGRDYFMAKSDLKDMFYNFPIRKEDWTFLGFSHPVTGQYLVLPFFAMGLGCSPPFCQDFAEEVRDIIKEEASRRRLGQESLPGLQVVPRTAAEEGGLSAAGDASAFTTEVYIDDFQHLTELLGQGLELFEIGARVYEILGLVEKIVKREGPARVMTLLGFEFNSTSGVLRIPSQKANEILALLRQVLDMARRGGAVSWANLSSLHGKLMWASTGIELGRAYLSAIRRPLDAVSALLVHRIQRALFLIPVSECLDMRLQLEWWESALSLNDGMARLYINGSGMYEVWAWHGAFGEEVPSDIVQVFTDACPFGGGWCWGAERQKFEWSSTEKRHHINVLEAETVLRLLRADAPSFDSCRVLLWCDNLVSVRALIKGQSRSRQLTRIVREIRLICLKHCISLCPRHIAGVLNVVSDGLSRGIVASRCESWSLNRNIMARWRARFGEFHVDAFCDPSGRGRQAPVFFSVIKEPFAVCFQGQRVFAFPPLHLASKFLSSMKYWKAKVLLAVLPMSLAKQEGLLPCLLHEYGSFQGIFTRPSGGGVLDCPPLGFSVGVFDLSSLSMSV
jgi:hypothetical protein